MCFGYRSDILVLDVKDDIEMFITIGKLGLSLWLMLRLIDDVVGQLDGGHVSPEITVPKAIKVCTIFGGFGYVVVPIHLNLPWLFSRLASC